MTLGLSNETLPLNQRGDRTKWYGQNVTDKIVAISIDFNSIELGIFRNHQLQISDKSKLV